MHARIATFQGDPANADRAIAAVRELIESQWESPPEGLENVKETLVLVNRETGQGLGLTMYETEEDLRRGDEALNAMSPPDEAGGERTNVSFYEVALRKQR